VPVPLRLVVEHLSPGDAPGAGPPPPDNDTGFVDDGADFEEIIELDGTREPPPAVTSPEERLKRAFPGAEEVAP